MPHLQGDRFHESCLSDDVELPGVPLYQELDIIHEEGPLALVRLYVDGLDPGGKSRKKAKQVYVFMWTPVGQKGIIKARRLIIVLLSARCCRSCGCRGRCTRNAIWKVVAWSFSAWRRGVHPPLGPFKEPLPKLLAALAGKDLTSKGGIERIEHVTVVNAPRHYEHHSCHFSITLQLPRTLLLCLRY